VEPITPAKPKTSKPKAQPAKSKSKTAAAPDTFASRQIEASNNKRSAALLFTPYKRQGGVGRSANEPQPSPTLQPAARLANRTQNVAQPARTQNVAQPARTQNVAQPARTQNVAQPAQNVAHHARNVAIQLVAENTSDDDVEEELQEGIQNLNFESGSDSQSPAGSDSQSPVGSGSGSGSQLPSRSTSRPASPSHSRHAPRAGPHSKPQKAAPKPRTSARDVWAFYTQKKKRHTCVLCQ
jgi:hypothetical protein